MPGSIGGSPIASGAFAADTRLGASGTVVATARKPVGAAAGSVGSVSITGTVVATARKPVAAAAGRVGVTGTVAATALKPLAAGVGRVGVTGSATATAPKPLSAVVGRVGVAGTIVATARKPIASAAGTVGANTGTAVAVAPRPIASSAGRVGVAGTMAATALKPLASSAGRVGVSGTVTAAALKPIGSATGRVSATGAAIATAPRPRGASAGTVGTSTVTGTIVATAVKPLAGSAGRVGVAGTVVAVAPKPVSAAVGKAGGTGTVVAMALRPNAAVVGKVGVKGTVVATTPKPSATVIGRIGITGAIFGFIPRPVAVAAGGVINPIPAVTVGLNWTTLQNMVAAALVQAPSPYTALPPDFMTLFPQCASYAEGRIYRDLVLLATRQQNTTLFTTPGSRQVNLALMANAFGGPLIVIEGLALLLPTAITNPATGSRAPFDRASLDVIDLIWPVESVVQTPSVISWNPQYWAMRDSSMIVLCPTPDAAYRVEVTGLFEPTPISAANPITYLSTVYPDLLFAACMVWMSGALMRNYGSQADESPQAMSWEKTYLTLKTGAENEERRRRGLAPDVAAPRMGAA